MTNLNKIDVNNVIRVYNGKANRCCCGCSGKHNYASAARGKGKEIRGYEIGEEEISDRAVLLAVNKINRAMKNDPDSVMYNNSYGSEWYAVQGQTRQTIVCLK